MFETVPSNTVDFIGFQKRCVNNVMLTIQKFLKVFFKLLRVHRRMLNISYLSVSVKCFNSFFTYLK